MSFTVKATQGGGTNAGTMLVVQVLTGATAAGGNSASSFGSGVLSASFTPTFSNSLIVCALDNVTAATAFTLAGNNSSWNSDPDSTDGFTGSASFYSGTVTASSAVTVGATAPTGNNTGYAIYEIQPSGGSTPVVDGSSPAAVNATATSATTAAFTPPAGSVLVALIACNGTGSAPNTTITMSDTSGLGLTWTQRANAATGGGAFVFTATMPPPLPVHVTQVTPGRTWLRYFRNPGYANQIPPPPAVTAAFAGAATATASANNATVITVSAPAVLPAYPGPAWRKHFQFPQQQQLSGPPPLAWATAGLATATGTANGVIGTTAPYLYTVAGTGEALYFTDQNSNPYMLRWDTVWNLIVNAGNSGGATTYQTDMDGYTAARSAEGFNGFLSTPVATSSIPSAPFNNGNTWDNVAPFSSPGVLNDPFWQRVDYLLNSARNAGMTVVLNVGYTYSLFNTGGPLHGWTTGQFQAYGAAIGARYASYPNLIWEVGDDYGGSWDGGLNGWDTQFAAILTGLRSSGATQMISVENMSEGSSRYSIDGATTYAWGVAHASFDWVYSYDVAYTAIENSYTEAANQSTTSLAVCKMDGWYDNQYNGGTLTESVELFARKWIWWSLSAGSRGAMYGQNELYQWQANTLANGLASSSPGSQYMQPSALNTAWNTFASFTGWHLLVPDTSSALVTAGRGTRSNGAFGTGAGTAGPTSMYLGGNTYVTASITPSGSLAVIYMPAANTQTITVNGSLMQAGYTATWVDPASGALTPTATAPTYTRSVANSAGDHDWLLVLQGPVPQTPVAQYALPGPAWRRYFRHPQQPVPPAPVVAAVSAPAGLATATGQALGQDTGADIAFVSPNAGLPAATGTSLGQDTGADIASVSANAGLAAATGTALGQDTGADIASVLPNAGLASATGTSLGQDTGADLASVAVNAGAASGTGTASGATAQVVLPQPAAYPGPVWRKFFQHPQQYAAFTAPPPTTNVSAGLASATGTSLGQDTGADLASVAPNSVLAGASSAGQNAAASLADTGGTASATGTGQAPGASVAATPATAAASGSALNATVLTVVTGPPPMMQIIPGRTWLRQYRHLQQPLPPPPFIPPALQNATSSPTVSPQSGSSARVTELASVSAGVSGG